MSDAQHDLVTFYLSTRDLNQMDDEARRVSAPAASHAAMGALISLARQRQAQYDNGELDSVEFASTMAKVANTVASVHLRVAASIDAEYPCLCGQRCRWGRA